MKKCSKCSIEKDLEQFTKNKLSKDGYNGYCKECRKTLNKEYNLKNKIRIKETAKKWHLNNKIKNNNRCKNYYANNNEKIRIKKKEYYNLNKEAASLRRKKYRLKHKNELIFSIKESVRHLIKNSFKRKDLAKISKTYEILGCSFEQFKLYLESKFESWMNWENKGLYNGEFKYGWDIDHIIPISTAKTENDVFLLNHYTNLQPLCSKINRDIKKDNYDSNK